MYTVKETAAMLGMTEHAVRFYSDKGLLPSIARDKNNIRIFDQECINWLNWIKCLRGCGMSIESIKKYVDLSALGESTLDERYKIILDQKKIALQQFEEAKMHLETINKKVSHYEDIINQKIPDDTNPSAIKPVK